LRAIAHCEEREEALRDERELDAPATIRDLETLEQVDASPGARCLDTDDIIPKINVHTSPPDGLDGEACNANQRHVTVRVGRSGSPEWIVAGGLGSIWTMR
jgi:hypothetical protein